MNSRSPSALDQTLARVCAICPVCRRARRRQRGLAFWLVQQVEVKLCPFCRAYQRVHGRPAHEGRPPAPPEAVAGSART